MSHAQNPDAFIITVEVGINTGLDFTVPISENLLNNYTVDFGDGTILINQTGNVTHTYSAPGIYTVTLSGVYKRIHFGGLFLNSRKLKTIEQWGSAQWSSMEAAFKNCENLIINATDTPDLSQVTNMASMFEGADSLNQSLNNWDVSNITNMDKVFLSASSFNQPLNNWDVSNVITMEAMFRKATVFNQSIDNWDVSNVTNMKQMFSSAKDFNQPLNNWDVSNVITMEAMFQSAISFNQPLNNWDVSSVTNMSEMFNSASVYNQILNDWDVSNVITLKGMFRHASVFNQPLNNWDVSNVIDMNSMFYGAKFFHQPIDNWDVSNVTDFGNMFGAALAFNQPLDNWDVSSAQYLYQMFQSATSFNQPLNSWDVSNVVNTWYMFSDASSFNQPLNNWNLSNVTIMESMFYKASSFNQDISSWTFNNVSNFYGFLGESGLNSLNYDLLLSRFAQLEIQNKTLGANGLHYCNSSVRDYLINTLNWTIYGDSLNTECNYNVVYGNVLFDENNDGCDSEDSSISTMFINADNGTPYYSTLPNNGQYQLNLFEDSYVVSLQNVPDYYTVTPESYTVSYTGFGNYEELNFCLTANQTISDLNVVLLPVSEARPGFEATYQLVVQNLGTQTISDVLVNLVFDNTKQTFVNATPAPESTTSNELVFEIASLSPFSSSTINLIMETFTPPTVNGEDILNFTATVTPNANDYTSEDNTFTLEQIVVNSYDPNDKQVLQGDKIHIDNVGEYLHYLIRFQNTGTASAIHVRIEDDLHETLDWSTIQIVSASHNYQVEISEDNQIEFIFQNINLPHEDADEAGSNGFIAYKIKPVEGLEIGDFIIGNEAGIYFDFNEPIITNSTSTEIVNPTVGIMPNVKDMLWVYPNPTSDILYIQTKGNIRLEEVQLYNLQGRVLISSKQNLQSIDVRDLSSGIYLLNIKTNEGNFSQRVIKK
jgi:surface protein